MAEITQLAAADEVTCAEINVVLHQLNEEKTCTLETLKNLIQSKTSELWVAKEEGKIVGIATLTLSVRLNGISARLEDVVVDEVERGKGIGRGLCVRIIERAKAHGAYSLLLTSRPERVVAHKLYEKLGFEPKKTDVYRLQL